MMPEAYGLTLVAVVAAMAFGVLRAGVLRPTILIVVGIAGVFCAGYFAGRITRPAEEGWAGAGQVKVPRQWAGSTTGETVSLAPPSETRGTILKSPNKISVDIFDSAAAGVLGNRETVALSNGDRLEVAGWANDGEANAPCKRVFVAIGTVRYDVPYGRARPDVAAYFHDPALTPTGFNAQIPTARLSKGAYPVRIECLSADAKTLFVLNRPRAVVIE